MRIGIFSESYEPIKNGVATSVKTLVDELRSRKHHVCVLAPHYPDHIDDSPFVLRVPSMLTPMNPDYPVPYPLFPRLRLEVKRLQLNVLHSQSPWFLGLLAVRLARQHCLPHISTYHTLYDQYAHYVTFLPEPATQSLLEWWLPEYYNQCDSVIVPSGVALQSLRDYGVTVPVTVIPTGVPAAHAYSLSAESKNRVRERWHIPAKAPLLLYVGRIAKEKNVEMVIRAFARIAEHFTDARLLVVGGGPNLESCEQLASEMPAGDRIIFAGPQPHEELEAIYAAADLFVFASTTETQGLVVSEARAAGTPSVVVNEGGAAETLVDGEEGLVVEPNEDAFAHGIRQILGTPIHLRRMRVQCLLNSHNHTPEAMARRVEAIYEEAVASSTRPWAGESQAAKVA